MTERTTFLVLWYSDGTLFSREILHLPKYMRDILYTDEFVSQIMHNRYLENGDIVQIFDLESKDIGYTSFEWNGGRWYNTTFKSVML